MDRELKLNVGILLAILVALTAVGRKTQFWPIMTWPMYSTLTTGFPSSEASIVELRVVMQNGERVRMTPREIFPRGHDKLSKWVIEDAYLGENASRSLANRQWLTSVVQDYFPRQQVKAIEGWKIVWDVQPLSVPPLYKDKPAKEVFLGSFNASPPTSVFIQTGEPVGVSPRTVSALTVIDARLAETFD